LNSATQFLLAIAGAQFGPGDLPMDAAGYAAVGAGDDVFSANGFAEHNDAISYHFRVSTTSWRG
jgi:hypothetical protein